MLEKALWGVALIVVVAVFYFSGDGFFRYPCQDPVNWTEAFCQPPICTANQTCPHDLMGEMNVAG